ncbi:MAG: aminotransferase class V-fold PLP-dependent enzyme [Acidobacteriaceae bacterium]|nr:aminotransferase class V-fold PLP-dependent enzyme [Acidobacteriaceae bacterium]MBV9501603.1 aminotransferase class V-fold PLP-dependent enzyme [Acidobacteriaceae bacterium]
MFSLPDGHCYLNSAYMGPLPVRVQQAGVEALVDRSFPGNITPVDFFEPAERARKLCAQLVNAKAESVAFVTSVSYGMASIAKNLSVRRGQNVVLLGDQFPSNVYPWREWRARGVQIRTVDAPDAPWSSARPGESRAARWNEAVIQAIDCGTALVSVEQAHWTDGTLFDLAHIGETCRKVGAAFVIDGTQTVGAMPLDLEQIRPDALVVHSYKAMLCNYGLGFMVLGERFASGCPLEQSWLMRQGSEKFSGLVEYEDRYVEGMRRFDASLRANPVLIRMLEAAAALLLQWRPERIRRYLFSIERGFVVRVREMGFEVADESERAANLFGLKAPPNFDIESCLAQLADRHIHVSLRGSMLRVSPHVYNDETDLERLAQALEAVRPR